MVNPFIVLVIHIIGLAGGDGNGIPHCFIVTHELEGAIDKLQGGICPEAGAGFGDIKVVGDGVVGIIQHQGGTIAAQQAADAGEESVGLAIAIASTGKTQESIARQLQ